MQGMLFKPWKAKFISEYKGEPQTRRLGGLKEINQEPDAWWLVAVFVDNTLFRFGNDKEDRDIMVKPRYQVGEVVYIKEAWETEKQYDDLPPRLIPKTARIWHIPRTILRGLQNLTPVGKWRSPLFMPAWAARRFVKILSNDPQRLQDITEEDATAEGFKADDVKTWWQGYRKWQFGDLGEDLIHQQSIGDNPPEWMIEPHKMIDRPDLRISARKWFSRIWDTINPSHPFESNPYVWVYSLERTDFHNAGI